MQVVLRLFVTLLTTAVLNCLPHRDVSEREEYGMTTRMWVVAGEMGRSRSRDATPGEMLCYSSPSCPDREALEVASWSYLGFILNSGCVKMTFDPSDGRDSYQSSW